MITEIPYKGLTTTPSDYECQDGEIAIAENIMPGEDGGLTTPSSPSVVMEFNYTSQPVTGDMKPLFIHTPNTGTIKNYIVLNSTLTNPQTRKVIWGTDVAGKFVPTQTQTEATKYEIFTLQSDEEIYEVTALGNVLVFLTSKGVSYATWKDGDYSYLGNSIPTIDLQFALSGDIQQSTILGFCKVDTGGNRETMFKSQDVYRESATIGDSTWQTSDAGTKHKTIDLGSVEDNQLKGGTVYKFVVDSEDREWYEHFDISGFSDSYYERAEINVEISTDGNNWIWLGRGKEMFQTLPGEDTVRYRYIHLYVNGWCIGLKYNLYIKESVSAVYHFIDEFAESGEENTNTLALLDKVKVAINNFLDNNGANDDKFVYPFFVRYALKMYDGTYICPSAPILMVPCSGETPYMWLPQSIVTHYQDGVKVDVVMSALFCDLQLRLLNSAEDYSDFKSKWGDIIKGIAIAVSAPISSYDNAYEYKKEVENVPIVSADITTDKGGYHMASIGNMDEHADRYREISQYSASVMKANLNGEFFRVQIPSFDDEEIRKKLTESSQFYIVKEYELDELVGGEPFRGIGLEYNTLKNLTTRTPLTDNASSLNQVVANKVFSYNGRINLANIIEKKPTGYDPALMQGYVSHYSYTEEYEDEQQQVRVRIKDNAISNVYQSRTTINVNGFEYNAQKGRGYTNGARTIWHYYPDYEAQSAFVVKDDGRNMYSSNIKLKRHALLNGAYYFEGWRDVLWNSMIEEKGTLTFTSDGVSASATLNVEDYGAAGRNVGIYDGGEFFPDVIVTIEELCEDVEVKTKECGIQNYGTRDSYTEFYVDEYVVVEEGGVEVRKYIDEVVIYFANERIGSTNVNVYVADRSEMDEHDDRFPDSTPKIIYPNQIRTSLVNNPFSFPDSNIAVVDAGKILGITAATMALSENQSGQSDVYVFTDNGVWAMSVGQDGVFMNIRAISRDVVFGNGESITQLDDSVAFASPRGIMLVAGHSPKCISTELDSVINNTANGIVGVLPEGWGAHTNGIPFKEYIEDCRIVFDYTNQRIVIFNPSYNYAYLLAVKGGKWNIVSRNNVSSVINAFPDAYAIDEDNNMVDFSTITNTQETREIPPTEEGGEPTYEDVPQEGWFITRPISLGNNNTRKIVDYVRQNGVFDGFVNDSTATATYNGDGANGNTNESLTTEKGYYKNDRVNQILYGSNDLKHWYTIGSSSSHRLDVMSDAKAPTLFRWYRLAVKTSFFVGDSLSSVTFSWRVKDENDKLY